MRRRRLLLLAVAAVCAVYVAVVAVRLVQARHDLAVGVDRLERARRAATVESLSGDAPLPGLAAARDDFAAGRRTLRSPVMWPLRVVPVVGRQLRSAESLATVARDIAGAAAVADDQARHALRLGTTGGPARLALVDRFRAIVGGLAGDVDRADLGPRRGLLPPLARARNDLRDKLVELRSSLARAEAGSAAVRSLLGGPRRYLLLAANNGEMRAGSGMFLQAGELTVDGGRLELSDMEPTATIDVPAGAVPATGDLAARWGWEDPTDDLRSLMLSPRFDVAAPLAARMWEAAGRARVDGVIVVDPVALQAVLRATGPVEAAGRTVTADGVVDDLLYRQYERHPDLSQRDQRRDELGRIARAAFDAVDAGDWDAGRLVTGLARAAQGRHLLVWARAAAEQRGWEALDVDGALSPASLLVALDSRGGNKLDRFVAVDATLDVRPGPGGRGVSGRLTLTLRNDAPHSPSRYLVGPAPGSGLREGEYGGVLAVSLPGRTTFGAIDGVPQLAVAGRDGPGVVVGTVVELARGETRRLVVRFRLPDRHGALRVEPSARIPRIKWHIAGQSWEDSRSRTVNY